MSVTFSGGITFTGGGFSFSAALPSTYTAGWWAGGGPGGNKSTVQRITFATDTNTASIRGPLSLNRQSGAGVNTFTYGWIGGGSAGSTIDRITFASDTSTASARGSITSASGTNGLGGTGNDNYGYYAGGGTPTNINARSTVNRITYTTDTDAASTRGPLSSAAAYLAGTGTNNYGYFGGGVVSGPNLSTVNRVDYANDTPTTSVRGPLSSARYGLAASTDSTTYGWYMAGYTNIAPTDVLSRVDRITYATDTATASIRGPLTIATYSLSGAGDSNYGWVAGTSPASTIVNRITYATDTATASSRGPLASAAYSMATCSGAQ